jgi:hypothetical protein
MLEYVASGTLFGFTAANVIPGCKVPTGQLLRSRAMPTPFPGMEPYLEQPALWPDVHNGLIAELRNTLAPQLRPRYYVALEERTYLAEPVGLSFVGRPDVTVVGAATPVLSQPSCVEQALAGVATREPVTVELPIPELVRETYLEIRQTQTHTVVAVLELLSPANKRPGEGRQHYGRKRMQVLASLTHLIEIDLLRGGEPMAMNTRGQPISSHYHVLISRAEHRPRAVLLPFNVSDPIPHFCLPLQPGDEEPIVDINRTLHDLYNRAGYDLRIDYRAEADPPLDGEDTVWVDALLRAAGRR